MSVRIIELFGFSPADSSQAAVKHRTDLQCPFLKGQCTKTLSDSTVSGVCTVKQIDLA